MYIQFNKTISFDSDQPLEMGWKLTVSAVGVGGAPDRVFIHQIFFGPKPGFSGSESDYEQDFLQVEWSGEKFLRVATEEEIRSLSTGNPSVLGTYPYLGANIPTDEGNKLYLKIGKFGFYKFLKNTLEEYHPTWDAANNRYLEVKAGLLALVQVEEDSAVGSVTIGIVGELPRRLSTLGNVFPGDVVRFTASGGSGDYTFSTDMPGVTSLDPATGRFVAGSVSKMGSAKITVTDNVSGETDSYILTAVHLDQTNTDNSSSEVLEDV